jgi:hypothetical protein
MNYFKSLVKSIYNSQCGIWLRNKVGFRPVKIILPNHLSNYSVSDAFFWRTDGGYVTYFRFYDIPKMYFDMEGTRVRFIFFGHNGRVLKEFELDEIQTFNELVINKEFLNGLQDYGTFSVFHVFDDKDRSDVKIINRHYVGFSKNNGIPSFVHGNIYARYWNPKTNKIMSDMVLISSKPTIYVVQKNFISYDYIELFFSNPTTKQIWATVTGQKIFLNSGESIILQVEPVNVVRIISNCCFLRPLIFTESNGYFDCLHA